MINKFMLYQQQFQRLILMIKYPEFNFTVVSGDFLKPDNDSFTFGYRYFVGFPLPEIYENVEL